VIFCKWVNNKPSWYITSRGGRIGWQQIWFNLKQFWLNTIWFNLLVIQAFHSDSWILKCSLDITEACSKALRKLTCFCRQKHNPAYLCAFYFCNYCSCCFISTSCSPIDSIMRLIIRTVNCHFWYICTIIIGSSYSFRFPLFFVFCVS